MNVSVDCSVVGFFSSVTGNFDVSDEAVVSAVIWCLAVEKLETDLEKNEIVLSLASQNFSKRLKLFNRPFFFMTRIVWLEYLVNI